jgi:hypothetical protein
MFWVYSWVKTLNNNNSILSPFFHQYPAFIGDSLLFSSKIGDGIHLNAGSLK